MKVLATSDLENYAVQIAGELGGSLREAVAVMSDAPRTVAAHLGNGWEAEQVLDWCLYVLNIKEVRQ